MQEVKCGDDQTEEQANEDQNSDDKGQKVLVQCNEKQKYDHKVKDQHVSDHYVQYSKVRQTSFVVSYQPFFNAS